MEKFFLIVAGGKGLRMNIDEPKQFVEINGKPLLMRTFEAFIFYKDTAKFVLVLNPDLIGRWKHLCQLHQFNFKHEIVEGGPKRFHSVKNGLRNIPDDTLVAIHDANRPFVSDQVINFGFAIAERKGNAIPAVVINESVRQIDGSINWSVNRNNYKLIQTPQFFKSNEIKQAYLQAYHEKYTDDASVLESGGNKIQLIDGNPENIKITEPGDLIYASALQTHWSKNPEQ